MMINTPRRQLLQTAAAASLGVGLGLGWTRHARAQAAAPQSLDELATRLKSAHASLRSLAVVHKGQTVVTHHRQSGLGDESLHNVASITKSVVSVLYAVAAQGGLALNVDASLLDVFPESRDWGVDARLGEVKLRHALSLSTGFDRLGATVDSDYQDFQRQFYGPDFLRFALTRKVLGIPGERFYYANADAHLAAMVLQRLLGQSLFAFASQQLFAPLGITGWRWARNVQGDVDGAATVQLRLRDLVALGELVRNGGMHGSQRLASESVLAQATSRQVATDAPTRGPKPELWGYGHLWWTATTPLTHQRAFFAAGYGGQFIYVAPALQLTIAATTQQISRAEGAKTAALIREQVLPVFERGSAKKGTCVSALGDCQSEPKHPRRTPAPSQQR